MTKLKDLVKYLNNLLHPEIYQDYCINGLQVEFCENQEIELVALAVDSGHLILEAAVQAGAGLLIAHHGIFWGKPEPITGPLASKIKLMLSSGLSLYASHLPLDGNIEVGNAAELARLLSLTDIKPAFNHAGQSIGVIAKASNSMQIQDIIKVTNSLDGSVSALNLEFGKKSIQSVGIVTGSGSSAITEAKHLELDLLISGEPQQKAYHLANELKQNVLFIGHYASETLGVKALGNKLADHFGVKTTFIDHPTGI